MAKKFNGALFLKKYLLIILFVVLLIVFGVGGKNFFSIANIRTILVQTSYTLIAALGVSMTIIVGGMDLSAGYIISLCSSIYGVLYIVKGVSVGIVLPVMVLASLAMGLLNGFLWTKLNMHPIIITISTQTLFHGFSYVLSNSETMLGVDDIVTFFGLGTIGGIPFCIILAVILLLVIAFMLNNTYFGRKLYATGGNEEVARLSGVNVKRMRIFAFMVCGFLCGITALILMGRSTVATPLTGPGTEITCITACLLGGVALGGGQGNVFNMSLAVLVLTMLSNGMISLKLDSYWQYVAKAIILILALTFDWYTNSKLTGAFTPKRKMKKVEAKE